MDLIERSVLIRRVGGQLGYGTFYFHLEHVGCFETKYKNSQTKKIIIIIIIIKYYNGVKLLHGRASDFHVQL